MLGSVVARRYQIVRSLGEGGMGTVYEATDLEAQRAVALKVITHDSVRSGTVLNRFRREGLAAAAIDSPHVTKVFDAGTDDATGNPYIAMERLVGEDVSALFRRLGPIPVGPALRIAVQACRGLVVAHEQGVVHRDIKPANLFLAQGDDATATVKLLDFGVAKMRPDMPSDVSDPALTRTGTLVGSPLYMSPEQLRGAREVDGRADVWSLGVVLYQALGGRAPMEHISALGELLIAICTTQTAPLRKIAPWVPPEVAAAVHRALAPGPEERFQSAAEMLAALTALVADDATIELATLVPLGAADRARVFADAPASVRPPMPTPQSHAAQVTDSGRRSVATAVRAPARILIVEDNEMNMDMLSRRLLRKGHEVLQARDGEAGLAIAASGRPDLIVMDISLPGMDGWETTRRLRADEATHDIPIIVLTAHAVGGEREKALRVGCDEYETKPVDLPRLLKKIDALVAAKGR